MFLDVFFSKELSFVKACKCCYSKEHDPGAANLTNLMT